MKKVLLFFGIFISAIPDVKCQSGIQISAGTTFFISPSNIVSIDSLVLKPSTSFIIAGNNGIVRNTTIAHPSSNQYISRVFNFSNTVNTFSGEITIYYNDAELKTLSESLLTLNIHNGTSWSDFSTGVIRDGSANFVQTSGLSNVSLNELTLASSMAPLPLKWGSVNAYRKGEVAFIDWQTYDESNTAFFQVESSTATRPWSPVGKPLMAFNTGGNHAYYIIDSFVTKAQTFYRIEQIDQDNNFSYSSKVSIKALNEQSILIVYPNPVTDQLTIHSTNSIITKEELFDAAGKLVLMQKVNSTNCKITLKKLPEGTYFLLTTLSNGTVENYQLIKK